MRELKQIELSEAFADSPFFRRTLCDHEMSLGNVARQIEATEALVRKLIKEAIRLYKGNIRLSRRVNAFEIVTTHPICGANIEQDFEKASAEIEKNEQKRKEGIDSAVMFYLRPLRDLRERINYILRKEAKEFEAASERYYTALKKNLAIDPRRSTDVKLSDACVAGKQRKFHIAAMQYVWQLQCVGEHIKVDFVEIVNEFVGSWMSEYSTEQSVVDSLKPALGDIHENVEAMKNRLDLLETKAARTKEAYLCTMAPNSMRSLPASNSATKEGYVFVQNAFLRRFDCRFSNRLSVAWSRQYAIFSKETHILTLIPASLSNANTFKETVEATESYKLFSCCPSTRTDRRFCFDVTVGNNSQSITIQAVSDEDFRCWMDLMEKADCNKAVVPS
ncbi:Protein T04C9.1 a [Aphelenchoides avenae]|nr:Protein T04C9.1 a [Aphelenchus avenae]